jgi:hypothetical protein
MMGDRRKLHNEEFHKLYSSPSKIRKMARVCSTNGENRNACKILVGKPEGRKQLGRQRRRCVGNIKMDLREIGWGVMNWIDR